MGAEYLKFSWYDSQSKAEGKEIFRCAGPYTLADGFLFANTDSNTVTVISTKARITGVLKVGIAIDELSHRTTIPDFSNGCKVRIEGQNGMIYTLERSNSLLTDIQFRLRQRPRRSIITLSYFSLPNQTFFC